MFIVEKLFVYGFSRRVRETSSCESGSYLRNTSRFTVKDSNGPIARSIAHDSRHSAPALLACTSLTVTHPKADIVG